MTTRSTAKSKAAFERAKKYFPGGVNSPVRSFASVGGNPFIVDRGRGPYLFDIDGNKYVDYICSWGPLVLGHAHPQVTEAITRQAELGTSYGACCEIESQLAEKVMALMPNIEMLRFVNSGTEAGMSVLRLARGFTGKKKILKFTGCYHGHADALLVKAGSGVATFGIPDCAGVNQDAVKDTLTTEFNDQQSVEKIFSTHGDDIAAVILEPVIGNAGLILPQPEYLNFLRKITLKHNALLIFDEVMTGFRVSLSGAQGHFGIKPDLTMLGKVIGGGLPVGAFGGRKDIMSKLAPSGPVYQAGTLSGNPLAMAAGLTTLNLWSENGVFEKTSKACKELSQTLKSYADNNGVPLVSDHLGTMFGFFFQSQLVHNMTDAKKSDTDAFNKFFHTALEIGLYFAPSQFEAGFISATHQGEALNYTIEMIGEIFSGW